MQGHSKILFVINPVAGGKVKHDWEVAIREFFKEVPGAIEFFLLTGSNDATSVKFYMEKIQPEVVVAIGGDGTVKMLATLLVGSNIKLGIIPAGSANGLATELNIPLHVQEAIEIILKGRCVPLDAICINKKDICLHLSDAGLNALLVKYFDQYKGRGMWGYARSLMKMFWQKKKFKVAIKTEENNYSRQAYMVVLANAEKYGTGAVINPEGSVADGKFEIVVVRKIHLVEIWKAIMARKNFDPKRIEIIKAKNVTLHFSRKSPFQIDGEYMGRIKSLQAEIIPAAVKVMLPH